MAIRNVVQVGDEILRKKSKPVREFDEKLWELLDDMRDTMVKNDGVGLAAVQVGVLRKAIVLDVNNMKLELVNPTIIDQYGEQIEREGCLSCKGQWGDVKRPKEVTVKAFFPVAKHKAFTVATPIRIPVKEPGPTTTAKKSRLLSETPNSSIASSI